MIDFKKELADVRSISDIFKIVKSAVWSTLKQSRSGLELGVANLDSREYEFLGAFHPMDSNIIVVNKKPLEKIVCLDKEIYNSYVFHILLYEYLRSMGYYNEKTRKDLVITISERAFGANHIASQMAIDIKKFFPNMYYSDRPPKTPEKPKIVKDFDSFATSYIR